MFYKFSNLHITVKLGRLRYTRRDTFEGCAVVSLQSRFATSRFVAYRGRFATYKSRFAAKDGSFSCNFL